MDTKLAFRISFLRQCTNNGLTIKQAKDLLQKLQTDKATLLKFAARIKRADPLDAILKTIGGVSHAVSDGAVAAGKAVGVPALLAAAVVPPAIGYAGGKMLSSATDYDDTDVQEIKLRELIDEYRRSTQSLQNTDNRKPIAVKRTAIR